MTTETETDAAYKAREDRLRRMLRRQGYGLCKSRRRTQHAYDYGTYMIIDPDINGVVGGPLMSLDDVQQWASADG